MIFSLESSQRFWYINGKYLWFRSAFPSYSISFSFWNVYCTLCLLVYQVLYSVYSQFRKVLTLCPFFVKSDGRPKNKNAPWPQFPIGQSGSYISWTFSFPWCLCVLVGYVLLYLNVFVVLFLTTIVLQSLLLSHISPAPQSNGHWADHGHNNHTRWQLHISI